MDQKKNKINVKNNIKKMNENTYLAIFYDFMFFVSILYNNNIIFLYQ